MDRHLSPDEKTLQSFEISVKGLDKVGTHDEARGTGSFGSAHEVEAHGLTCIAKCIHPILIRYEQQTQGRAPGNVEQEKKTIRQRFYRECVLLSKLRHPNIVQFLGVARVPHTGEMALIMEALFSDLGKLVEKYKEISDPVKISMMFDVANGLLYLHLQNPPIVHRDLSAANVLVSVDLRAKIADLGVAKLLDNSMITGQHTAQPGAYAYMAPEAISEHPRYGVELDVFSFGAILLYVINNKFPKAHEILSLTDVKDGEIQIAKRRIAIKAAERHCLCQLAIQCLQDRPEKRPSTKEVKDAVLEISIRYPRKLGIENENNQKSSESQSASAQLEVVTQEKNELLRNQERANAQWEERVRRLERQLQAQEKPALVCFDIPYFIICTLCHDYHDHRHIHGSSRIIS